jgi:hypothetical protein
MKYTSISTQITTHEIINWHCQLTSSNHRKNRLFWYQLSAFLGKQTAAFNGGQESGDKVLGVLSVLWGTSIILLSTSGIKSQYYRNPWIGYAGTISQPARSPDLTLLDFLWNLNKEVAYKTKVRYSSTK